MEWFILFCMFATVESAFDVTTWGCNVTEEEKVECGPSGMSEDRCIKYGCCYNASASTMCYHSSMNVPGFVRGKGDCTNSARVPNVNGSLTECANECFRQSTCTSFAYDPNNENCRFAGTTCKGMAYNLDWYNYLKVGFEGYTCKYIACDDHNVSQLADAKPKDCMGSCDGDSQCAIVQLSRRNLGNYDGCINNGPNCTLDLAKLQSTGRDSYTCYKGEFIRTSFNEYQNNAAIRTLSDKNFGTCMSAVEFDTNLKELEARFAWPAMPRQNIEMFFAYIHGLDDLPCQIITVFVPGPGVGNAFTKPANQRKYLKCKFLNEFSAEGSKRCSYDCRCQGSFCEAVYVKVPRNDIKLCEVVFYDK